MPTIPSFGPGPTLGRPTAIRRCGHKGDAEESMARKVPAPDCRVRGDRRARPGVLPGNSVGLAPTADSAASATCRTSETQANTGSDGPEGCPGGRLPQPDRTRTVTAHQSDNAMIVSVMPARLACCYRPIYPGRAGDAGHHPNSWRRHYNRRTGCTRQKTGSHPATVECHKMRESERELFQIKAKVGGPPPVAADGCRLSPRLTAAGSGSSAGDSWLPATGIPHK